MKSTWCAGVIVGFMATFAPHLSAAAEPIDFRPDADFVKLPDSITLGACSGVAVNSRGDIYLFHRGKQPIICLDASGKFIRSWGDDVIGSAHGLRIDRDDNVWVTDIGNHQVLKFSSTGKLLLALGKAGSAGDGIDQFNKPTDVAFGPDGELYVTDGYGNNRVMKFTPNGGFLAQWGEAGDGPAQFNLPHTIVMDRQGRIVVGDRENDRVQVFESSGKLVEVWPGFAPFGLTYDKQGHLFVADGRANKVLQLDDKGKVVRSWGQEGNQPGEFQLPHMLAADADGNLYVGEIKGERFQKLIRK
ncbi:MAG TPA: peptidyl-alpha-hydroxyglycine alpha-amidating lyase family protein [Pirellulaceae bacterium]|nr:peptidyl-alpha-hydroxyglycine alpha-amidating lyase family protein [Pirellulaceae bacterium]